MKRIYFVVAVFLMVSCPAEGVVTLQVDGEEASRYEINPIVVGLDEVITLSVHSSVTHLNYGALIGIDDSESVKIMPPVHVLPAAGPGASATDLSDNWPGTWWFLEALSWSPYTRPVAGKHFEFQVQLTDSAPTDSPVWVSLYDFNHNFSGNGLPLGTVGFIRESANIPEPTTILLLGLGGMAVMRRRRR